MSVFFATTLLIGSLFMVHLVWWRVGLPRRQRAALLVLFFSGSLILAPAVGFVLGKVGVEPLSWIQWLNVALAIVAFTLAYVVTYSALEADSPTLSLVRHISAAGASGVREEELVTFMASRPFVGARLSALLEEGMIHEREGRIHLAEHPYTLFRLVLLHREKVLGLTHHGG
jgi:hypothetical protein